MTRVPRFMLVAQASGSGKTTLACGILRLLQRRGLRPAALKCGPDYIDPHFHRSVTGVPGGNLDLFFTDERTCASLLARAAADCDVALIEGVMGYYDGILGAGTRASSYEVARATRTPAVLVLNARGASMTLAAQVRGIAEFRSDANIAGVILNGCAPSLCARLADDIEHESGVPVLGCLPRDGAYALESRHLGLVEPGEVEGLRARVDRIADGLQETLDLDHLLAVAQAAPPLEVETYASARVTDAAPTIAVADDSAFSFYYAENLRMLEDMGARVVRFSPLADAALPAGASALYLGGGYPELHARDLAENASMREAVRLAVAAGMPTIAECGGFMYLQGELVDDAGATWPMAGALEGCSHNEGRLRHFGYVELVTNGAGLPGPAGTRVRAHEFHYWHSTCEGTDCAASKPAVPTSSAGLADASWQCAVVRESLFAGYPHVYFPAHPQLAENFVRAAAAFSRGTDAALSCEADASAPWPSSPKGAGDAS